MDVKTAIKERRAYRSLEPVDITGELINDLAESAQLAPSCFNNQPWRYVFVYESERLEKLHAALSKGNDWAKHAPMIIAVFSRREDDCIIKEREYHLFDVGMATAHMILRATELGYVLHPIAGYDPAKVAEVLGIPQEYQVVTLLIFGRHSKKVADYLSDKQRESEVTRPQRKTLEEFAFIDHFNNQ